MRVLHYLGAGVRGGPPRMPPITLLEEGRWTTRVLGLDGSVPEHADPRLGVGTAASDIGPLKQLREADLDARCSSFRYRRRGC